MQRVALFPGSFAPFTIGHKAIVDRALSLFDKLVIAIGINRNKNIDLLQDGRLENIKRLYADEAKVDVVYYDCLTVDLAEQYGARYIVRGVRSVADFEYERNIADINRRLSGIETVLLFAEPDMEHVSSSLVRELESFGKDVSAFLP